jgi:hypothetical protein
MAVTEVVTTKVVLAEELQHMVLAEAVAVLVETGQVLTQQVEGHLVQES